MMGYYGWGFGPGISIFGSIIGIVFWVLLILLVVGLIKWFVSGEHGESETNEDKSDNALKILKERYAKGEINKKEFDQMKKDIS